MKYDIFFVLHVQHKPVCSNFACVYTYANVRVCVCVCEKRLVITFANIQLGAYTVLYRSRLTTKHTSKIYPHTKSKNYKISHTLRNPTEDTSPK